MERQRAEAAIKRADASTGKLAQLELERDAKWRKKSELRETQTACRGKKCERSKAPTEETEAGKKEETWQIAMRLKIVLACRGAGRNKKGTEPESTRL